MIMAYYGYGFLASNDDTTWITEQNWVANLLSAISVLVREVPVLAHTHTHMPKWRAYMNMYV